MEKKQHIRYFPVGLFVSVMGFSGVTLAVRQLEMLFDLTHIMSNLLLGLSSLLFLVNAIILLYRFITYREEVNADFNHPVKMNFFGAISISLLLLGAAYLGISIQVSLILWMIGTVLQIGLTVVIVSRLTWHHDFKMQQMNPTWFIPIVGNIIVPIAGTAHVALDVNWFFFSIGVIFTMMYMTLFFNRMFFHPPLPEMLRPTFFILMAPPAIGFVSYISMVKTIDGFGYILYGIAFFIGLLLLFQIKRFISVPFSISWWALLFPSAAMTTATINLYHQNGYLFYKWLFVVQVVGLMLLTIYLVIKTIGLFKNGKLCVKG